MYMYIVYICTKLGKFVTSIKLSPDCCKIIVFHLYKGTQSGDVLIHNDTPIKAHNKLISLCVCSKDSTQRCILMI